MSFRSSGASPILNSFGIGDRISASLAFFRLRSRSCRIVPKSSAHLRHYYLNLAFQVKITFLVLAIIYNYTIHRKVAMSAEGRPAVVKFVAGVSLVLWATVTFGGLFIAFE